jgi:hypothetical protein
MHNSKHDMTIDLKHEEICKGFRHNRTHVIPKLEAEIKKLRCQDIDNKNMHIRIKQLQRKINNLRKKEKDYFLTNSEFVHDYFESKKNIGVDDATVVLDTFFNGDANKCSRKMSDVDKYFANLDDRFIGLHNYVYNKDVCHSCGEGEMVLVAQDGIIVCDKCSASRPYIIDTDTTPYKEMPKEVSFFAYKRINHFREVLAQFQGKQNTHIPDEIIENIRLQLKKERTRVEDMDNKMMKTTLKNMGLNKYYEHIPFIKHKLGIKPPIMSQSLEEMLCSMFMRIQSPYAKHCPTHRVNFLNYYYTVYKMCELLDQRQFLPFFPMLKDRDKRIEQDDIWKKICAELGWEFIPTV